MSITVKLADLLHTVNERNELSTCSREMRQGWNSILEHFLMAAGCFIGFGYLMGWDVPEGILPGMEYVDPDGESLTQDEFLWEMSIANSEGRKPACGKTFPDDSRRTYYVARELQADYQAAEERASRPGEIEAPETPETNVETPETNVETSEEYL